MNELTLGRFFLYLIVMAGVTYLVRAVPLVLIKKKITNVFIRSFLAYIPCAVLAAMTFPGILYATGSFASAVVGTVGAIVLSYFGAGLPVVALVSFILVFVSGFFM